MSRPLRSPAATAISPIRNAIFLSNIGFIILASSGCMSEFVRMGGGNSWSPFRLLELVVMVLAFVLDPSVITRPGTYELADESELPVLANDGTYEPPGA